jgi:hypothetical protein
MNDKPLINHEQEEKFFILRVDSNLEGISANLRSRGILFVIPAKAGIQGDSSE